jgi:hypothetical protein
MILDRQLFPVMQNGDCDCTHAITVLYPSYNVAMWEAGRLAGGAVGSDRITCE